MPQNGAKARLGRPVVGPYNDQIKAMLTREARLYLEREAARQKVTVSEVVRQAVHLHAQASKKVRVA